MRGTLTQDMIIIKTNLIAKSMRNAVRLRLGESVPVTVTMFVTIIKIVVPNLHIIQISIVAVMCSTRLVLNQSTAVFPM